MKIHTRAAGLLLLGSLGCDSAHTEPSANPATEVLAPVNLAQSLQQAAERQRVQNAEGALLPSDQDIAGLPLPRGLRPTHTFEHEWYFQTEASLEQLISYFGQRLITGQVERGGLGRVTYKQAQPKNSRSKAYLTVRLGPAPGGDPKHREVFIAETEMMPVRYPSQAESLRQLDELRRFAD